LARFLAIDWDQGQLHVVAADVGKRAVRVLRAKFWQVGQTPNPANAEDMGKLLRERLRDAGIAPGPLLACLGRDRLIIKQIRFPAVPETEEPAVVRFQAVKELTDAAEDVVIDYVRTGQANGEQKASALVVRREVLDTYQKLADAAGLKLAALTPRLMGVSACLRKVMGTTVLTPPPEPADAAICAVVVGEQLAEVCILRGETVLLARSVPAGAALAAEIRRNLAVHAGQVPQHPVKAVYVTGKDSGELQLRLGGMIEEPVYGFDPLADFTGPDLPDEETSRALAGITPAPGPGKLPRGNRGTFAGPVGLLHLRAGDETHVNFVSPRQPKLPSNPNYRLARLAIVASVVFVVGLVVLGRVLHASWSDQLAQVTEDSARLDKQLADTRANAKRLKGIDDWDNVGWLDELYDLTARIPDTNALRVTSIAAEPLARNGKSRVAAKATIKGKLLGRNASRRPLDQLISQFAKDGFYSTEAPKVENDSFTLVVYVERRAPGEYLHQIKDEKIKAEMEAAAKADQAGQKGKGGPWGAWGGAGRGKGGMGRGKGPDKAEDAAEEGPGRGKAKGGRRGPDNE
jgi:hypothetical protein